MAGYFHQLAQQALQPAPQLHPTAALPYSQAQDWRAEVSETPSPLPGDVDRIRESAVTPTEQQTPRSRLGLTMQDEPAIRSTKPSLETTTVERHSPSPTTFRTTHPSNSQAAPDEIADAPQIRTSIASIASLAAPQAEQHVATSVAARPEQLAASPPEFLRPTPAPVAIRPQRSASQSELPTSQRATPAPEVHIHIGRIELTAVSPPTAPRRGSTPGKQPMSLDEYLQSRRPSKGTGMS